MATVIEGPKALSSFSTLPKVTLLSKGSCTDVMQRICNDDNTLRAIFHSLEKRCGNKAPMMPERQTHKANVLAASLIA